MKAVSFIRVSLLAFSCSLALGKEAEKEVVHLSEYKPLEDKLLGRLVESNDGPFERHIKKLVADYLLATAIESVGNVSVVDDTPKGRALLQQPPPNYYPQQQQGGNYYPAPQPQQQQPQIVYVYGTPPPATPTGRTRRTRRTRRPGSHHNHHHQESSEERNTQPPQTVIQPVYVPQPPYNPQYQPPYNPQYQPQPPYNPQYQPQQPQYPSNSQQPPYNPQYQPQPPQQPSYQPQQPQQPVYQPPPAAPPTQQLPTAPVDSPQDSVVGESTSNTDKDKSQVSPTLAPIPTIQTLLPQSSSQAPQQPQSPNQGTVQQPVAPQQPVPPPSQSQPPPNPGYPPQYPQQQPQYPIQQQPPPPIMVVYVPPNGTVASGPTGPTTTPRPRPSQEHIYNQVNKILDNVAGGSITGIVDAALGIRTPMPTRNFVNGILQTVFCNPVNRLLGRCRGSGS